MYQQRVKDNWGRIIEWFTQAYGEVTYWDIPERVEEFAHEMFVREEPELAEQEEEITIRDRLKHIF